jgi:hypothetical protein
LKTPPRWSNFINRARQEVVRLLDAHAARLGDAHLGRASLARPRDEVLHQAHRGDRAPAVRAHEEGEVGRAFRARIPELGGVADQEAVQALWPIRHADEAVQQAVHEHRAHLALVEFDMAEVALGVHVPAERDDRLEVLVPRAPSRQRSPA